MQTIQTPAENAYYKRIIKEQTLDIAGLYRKNNRLTRRLKYARVIIYILILIILGLLTKI